MVIQGGLYLWQLIATSRILLTSGYGGNAWYGIISFLVGVLWLTALLKLILRRI